MNEQIQEFKKTLNKFKSEMFQNISDEFSRAEKAGDGINMNIILRQNIIFDEKLQNAIIELENGFGRKQKKGFF